MGEGTRIEWTDHTFNPWWGCTKVSDGCDHCYAETFDRRYGGRHWGPGAARRVFGDEHWAEPLKWNREAQAAGARRRVFCASMADVFDAEAPPELRARLWELIKATPSLDWLLLTKRPQNIARMLPPDWDWRSGWPNVWLGTTTEDRTRWRQRVRVLAKIPAACRFVSAEPLLEGLCLTTDDLLSMTCTSCRSTNVDDAEGHCYDCGQGPVVARPIIDWLIVGGESGSGARPFELAWARELVRACAASTVAVFVKQLGAAASDEVNGIAGAALKVPPEAAGLISLRLRNAKGGDWDEWPKDLRVRQFPQLRREVLPCDR